MARSLNRAQLIGNLTRDPELRYTPSGTAVCSFSIATNRNWTTDSGEKKEEVEFHRIVAWNKLAELCSQFLTKGRKVFVEGRITTRSWAAQDGTQKQTTEIIINDMILLDNRRPGGEQGAVAAEDEVQESPKEESEKPTKAKKTKEEEPVQETPSEDEVAPDDIPF
ncbi:MAG TPA: single-stranded DNA-binding protein [Patescibacteria group bacterium]|jgi:single-strand DNA-binding protein|nr:single-stranded DNA-binding protein [Patescibacteria group bacterium]